MFKDIQNITTLPANSFLCCFFICWLQEARKDARDWASRPKRWYTSIKKWLQQAREYVLIWLQLIFQRTSVISYCDVLLNVTWDIESFVFEIMILNLICCNSDKWAENLMSFELKCCYDEWADCLSGMKFDGPLWWAEKFMGWNTRRQPPCHHNIPCQHHIIGYVSASSLAMSAPHHVSASSLAMSSSLSMSMSIHDVYFRHKK